MARLPRIVLPKQPLHIMHRGNNRQAIFDTDEDFQRFKDDLAISLSRSACRLHAYVLMTNHIHLLLTPSDKEQLSVFMQSLANRYARYFNASRDRTGTIWEGRFKSCLVDSDAYLFTLYKYIEMNPVKANMVTDISHYPWSSYQHNALGKEDKLISAHELYQQLGATNQQRAECYRALFAELTDHHDKRITEATYRGEVLGGEDFHEKVGEVVARPTKLTSHGGDRRSEENKNQAG